MKKIFLLLIVFFNVLFVKAQNWQVENEKNTNYEYVNYTANGLFNGIIAGSNLTVSIDVYNDPRYVNIPFITLDLIEYDEESAIFSDSIVKVEFLPIVVKTLDKNNRTIYDRPIVISFTNDKGLSVNCNSEYENIQLRKFLDILINRSALDCIIKTRSKEYFFTLYCKNFKKQYMGIGTRNRARNNT